MPLFSPHFLATFWSLELYDIRCPDDRYAAERARLLNVIGDLDRDFGQLTGSAAREQSKALRSKIEELRDRLVQDAKVHLAQYMGTRKRLLAEKKAWFPGALARLAPADHY